MGKIVGAHVIGTEENAILVRELHSTKGWKPVTEVNPRWFAGKPIIGTFSKRPKRDDAALFAEAGRLMRGRTLVAVRDPQGSTRHLQRHGWYRRQQRKLTAALASDIKETADALAAM